MGTGIFLLPASLAAFGTVSILAFGIVTLGALALAVVFGRLGRRIPASGGPYAYARDSFGEFPGFMNAWSFWITAWAGNAGIAVAWVGYVVHFADAAFGLDWSGTAAQVVIGLIGLWIPALINLAGVTKMGAFQLVTTILKFAPLIFVAIVGLFFVQSADFGPFNATGGSWIGAVSVSAALVLFAYSGVESVGIAAASLAELAREHELVITHGNGPQVGVLALESATDPNLTRPYPLDTLGAQTQGMIGYWMLQALQNALPGRQVISMVNQTLVSAVDPAFDDPTKFVGQVYDRAEAGKLAAENGWAVKPDGPYWRRVVPSPAPQRVVETRLIRSLVRDGVVVVCAGGGGVPVIRNGNGRLQGIEAVIDKDLTGSMLAEALECDAFLILTDVPRVMKGFGTPEQQEIRHTTPHELRELDFPAGSMGPKVEAACRFVETTGDMAAVGRLDQAVQILEGTAGTIVTPNATWPLASTL
ncbi:hypothetical protein Pve01_28920 [Planomonospora venezuelensis]|uniref:Carbamate kinase n=1 Tax=Planomonospora venezuelensis TaxID=1999 RepID=A0A841DL44_PLAVE|nr:carbamate kinase [Planomonospora venezuelensis]GIN01234.1 hypothetical protein Pve01_28920 [Planomonospora venezuelensis]